MGETPMPLTPRHVSVDNAARISPGIAIALNPCSFTAQQTLVNCPFATASPLTEKSTSYVSDLPPTFVIRNASVTSSSNRAGRRYSQLVAIRGQEI